MVIKKGFFPALIFSAAVVFMAELTLGNPKFPFTVWRFDLIPQWQWSVPVHAAGFLWLLLLSRFFYEKKIILPILASTLFFLCCETLNWYFFHFFVYEDDPLGPSGSFWFIIILYSGLCTVTCFLLRKKIEFAKGG